MCIRDRLLLPQIGYFSTAFLVGSLNLGISLFILFSYRRFISHFSVWKWVGVLSCVLMAAGMLFSENLAGQVEQGLYRDKVILAEQTPYQKLVLTRHKDDVRLFINGNIQFSSKDEYRYHEALVHVPMAAAKRKERVLILGGGDGLAVRELLKYPEISDIVLVDLDPEVVKMCIRDRFCPVGMIFVPSRDGLSHCPEEWTDDQYLETGSQVLAAVLAELANEE